MNIIKALDFNNRELLLCPNSREGGDCMARKKTAEEMRLAREKAEQDLKLRQEALKKLKQKEAELTRKERTHRLCTHGAMLEQYLPPEEYTDEQIDKFLRTLFQIPEVMQMLHRVTEETNEPPETE